ncbi:MAG: hypothetical protein ACRD1T_11355, partial [Acidimicrobiia bacterium]
ELDRPGARRLALGVVGADGVGVLLPMSGEAVGGEHDIKVGADTDLRRPVVALGGVDMANDLVPGSPTATRPGGGVESFV